MYMFYMYVCMYIFLDLNTASRKTYKLRKVAIQSINVNEAKSWFSSIMIFFFLLEVDLSKKKKRIHP